MPERGKVSDLLTVTLLFRSKSAFSDLPHVVTSVSLLLDSSVDLPLHKACKLDSLKLLDRIWTSAEIYTDNVNTDDSWTLRRYLRSDRHYRQYQFTRSLTEAIRVKKVKMVKWLAAKFQGLKVRKDVVVEAAAAGSFKILQFFYQSDNSTAAPSIRDDGVGLGIEWTGDHLTAAVKNGHSDVAWWLATHFPHEWLLARGTVWGRGDSVTPAHHAASSGRVDILQWLARQGQLDNAIGLVVAAGKAGQLQVSQAIHAAAFNGCPRVAKYLRARTKAPTDSLQRAKLALEQNRQVQLFSRTFGNRNEAAPVSGKTMTLAAMNGHLAVVKWLYDEYGSEPDIDLFDIGETRALYPLIYANAMDAAASTT